MAMLAREEVEKITLTENQKQHTYVRKARESEASGIDVSKEKRRGIIVAFNGPPYYTWVNHS